MNLCFPLIRCFWATSINENELRKIHEDFKSRIILIISLPDFKLPDEIKLSSVHIRISPNNGRFEQILSPRTTRYRCTNSRSNYAVTLFPQESDPMLDGPQIRVSPLEVTPLNADSIQQIRGFRAHRVKLRSKLRRKHTEENLAGAPKRSPSQHPGSPAGRCRLVLATSPSWMIVHELKHSDLFLVSTRAECPASDCYSLIT